jgi:hypothetical protein
MAACCSAAAAILRNKAALAGSGSADATAFDKKAAVFSARQRSIAGSTVQAL